MFTCENCNTTVRTRQPENKVVTEKRIKQYQKKSKTDRHDVDLIYGWEIVKEIRACPSCFEQLTGMEPRLIVEQSPPTTQRQRRRKKSFQDEHPHKKRHVNHQRKKPVVEKVKRPPNAFKQAK